MSAERIPVVPEVMKWARTSIGLDESNAAARLGVSIATLQKWEDGDVEPTIKQLRNAAGVYKRPLAVLLLPIPPHDYEPLKDFRRLAGATERPLTPEFHVELRRAQSQREVFLELADIAPESLPPISMPPEISVGESVEEAALKLRRFLQVSMDMQASWRDGYDALNHWVTSLEAKGFIVMHTRNVSIDEARGFSVNEWPYPVIALNGSDWPKARVFTLLHEAVHLSLREGGICDLHESGHTPGSHSDHLEHFCNQVAAAAIVPQEDLLVLPAFQSASKDGDWSLETLALLAQRYWVSTEALLLRLISLGRASWDKYWERKPELDKAYAEARARQKRERQQSESGPSYYRVKARDIGHGYAHSVLDAYHARAISSVDVSDYLFVKFNQIPKLEVELR